MDKNENVSVKYLHIKRHHLISSVVSWHEGRYERWCPPQTTIFR